MEEYWESRTGRWRRAMRAEHGPSLADRLYQVIRHDVEASMLPAGALVPTSERVANELSIEPADVQAAYERLLADGLLEQRTGGLLSITSRGCETSVGDATQIRFEAALLKAVREAAARGLSTTESTGMFKAEVIRLHALENSKKPTE